MSANVWITGNNLDYPEGGGHLWVYLNWALGLRAAGCKVTWLEAVDPAMQPAQLQMFVAALRHRLARYDLNEVVLCSPGGNSLNAEMANGCAGIDGAGEADLLLNLRYDLTADLVSRFRRSAFIDIDPGELQIWMSKAEIVIPRHDIYFSIGETVGTPGALFPDGGVRWNFTPPCVATNWWPPRRCAADAPFTTVAHWYDGWMEDAWGGYGDGKRSAFLPYLDLPARISQPLELSLDLVSEDEDQLLLWKHGWRVREATAVASTPWDYQHYVQDSAGEFSCAKAHCVRLQNAWISDRSLCYLASGKPVVVQHTGPSRYLPNADGMFRFRDMDEAINAFDVLSSQYERQCHRALDLAHAYFDATKVVSRVLETTLAVTIPAV